MGEQTVNNSRLNLSLQRHTMLLAKRKLGSKFREEIFVPRRQDCHYVTINPACGSANLI